MESLENNVITTLNAGMIKDVDPQLLKEGQYTHAINSQLNSHQGNFSFIQNEPGNKLCLTLPNNLQFLNAIPLQNSRFAILSTNAITSEIGIYDSKTCTYTTVVNHPCLNFKTTNIPKGISKENYDCSETIYFADELNPNRFLNLSNVPYKYTFADDACKTKVYTTELDCDQLLIDQLINVPCLTISKSQAGGTLINGSYQVCMAYSINGQIVTNYYSTTNPQPIFTHENLGQAIDVEITNLDPDFSEFQLFLIATVAQQTTVYKVGTYNIGTTAVTISSIIENTNVPLSDLFFQKVVYTTSRDVISVDNRALWIGAKTKVELDYQYLANQVTAKWVAYAVPVDYYKNGGSIVGYMRDETYAFGIQWLFNTGDYSPVYPLVGRAAVPSDRVKITNKDAYEFFAKNCEPVKAVEKWQAYNTATGAIPTIPASDCKEFVVATGNMAYVESTEHYPNNTALYGDLACTPIRHFKFPDECIVPRKVNGNDTQMLILGIQFENIKHPVDSNGDPLTNIVGYRIVRSDRSNNKTILGKGLMFNAAKYDLPVSDKTTIPAIYPNYPFNDLRTDGFLSKTPVKGGTKEKGYTPMGEYLNDYFTFHSPSFSFAKPSFGTELVIEAENYGQSHSQFTDVYGHPKHQILTDVAFIVASMLGIAEGLFATQDKICETTIIKALNTGVTGTPGTSLPNPAMATAISSYLSTKSTLEATRTPATSKIVDDAIDAALKSATAGATAALSLPGLGGEVTYSSEKCKNMLDAIPSLLRIANDVYLFSFYFQQGFETALNAIRNFGNFQQYGLQVNSHCYYNNFACALEGNKRRYLDNVNYLYPAMQDFEGYRVNNFNRESSVILKLNDSILPPRNQDNSRQTLKESQACDTFEFNAQASSYYASIRQKLPAQYGQVDSITWLNTGACHVIDTVQKSYSSGPVFGGDTYLNRFSVKRKLQYFNQYEFMENNGHEFNYTKYYNIPYARYWMNTEAFDISSLISLDPKIPNDFHNFDRCHKKGKTSKLNAPFIINNEYFYLSNNSVIDFFVESEINIDYRDWEEQPYLRHYDKDTYNNLNTLFRSDYLQYDNRYLYDKSLSKQLTENYCMTQNIYFNKSLSETCFSYYPNRVYWSLPYQKEQIKDSWGFYLPGNYFDFPGVAGKLTAGKALNRTNILFLFEESAPYLHLAQDTLELDSGLKVTIGDGGLFANPPAPIMNTDVKYGNCESRFALTNTQHGLFYASIRQGRVFNVQAGGGLKEISLGGMSFWFKKNMPYKLLKDFPNYPYTDNTIIGIGYQSVYDNTDEIYYLTKRDFKLRSDLEGTTVYDSTTNKFRYTLKGVTYTINLTDPRYFDDASWTISYSPKTETWISFHDWHPNSLLQEETKFCSIITPTTGSSSLWRHNDRCDVYSNFYNTQYPWEIEYVVNNGMKTSTLQNIEYSLECYKYYNDCDDNHHLLDYNFNEAIISNTEQVSGLLKLNLQAKNQMSAVLAYPKINSNFIDIEYSKVEQKYRFNQFWDITNDRTNAIQTFITDADGYHSVINPLYVDYNKPPFERKKFRHNWQKVMLRRTHEDDSVQPKMILKFNNNKQIISPR